MKKDATFGILPAALNILEKYANKEFSNMDEYMDYAETAQALSDWEFRIHANQVKKYFDKNSSDVVKEFVATFFQMEFQRRNVEIEYVII